MRALRKTAKKMEIDTGIKIGAKNGMKKNGIKEKGAAMNSMLAVMLAAIMACAPIPAAHVSAETAGPDMTEGADVRLEPALEESQSFYYIDEEDVDGLGFEASESDVFSVVSGKDTNPTRLIRVNKGTVTKNLKEPITAGKVTLETVGYQNSAIFGIKILDSKGNALVNYSQQTSGNLNIYKGTAITGSENTIKLASQDDLKVKNNWIRVVTEIDLDSSMQKGVLQFVMTVSYKSDYTDGEWKEAGVYTQKEA